MAGKMSVTSSVRSGSFLVLGWLGSGRLLGVHLVTICLLFFLQTMYGLLCLLHISHNERGFQKAMKQKIRIPNSDITLVLVEKRNWW